jgi:hypothetical protein
MMPAKQEAEEIPAKWVSGLVDGGLKGRLRARLPATQGGRLHATKGQTPESSAARPAGGIFSCFVSSGMETAKPEKFVAGFWPLVKLVAAPCVPFNRPTEKTNLANLLGPGSAERAGESRAELLAAFDDQAKPFLCVCSMAIDEHCDSMDNHSVSFVVHCSDWQRRSGSSILRSSTSAAALSCNDYHVHCK